MRAVVVPACLVVAPAVAAGPVMAAGNAGPAGSTGLVETVTCPDVGTFSVALPSGVATEPLPPELRLSVSYRATDSRTSAAVAGGQPAGATPCASFPFSDIQARDLSPAALPPGVAAGDHLTGHWSVTVTVAAPEAPAASPTARVPAARVPAISPFPFDQALRSYLSTRSGNVAAAVYNLADDTTYAAAPQSSFITASIVKVDILATLVRMASDAGRGLTSQEQATAANMIEFSDNSAATALWNEVGGAGGVAQFNSLVGMPGTVPGPGGFWGLTRTTAPDQVQLLRTVAYPNQVLTNGQRAYIQSLMQNVTPSQRWGVSGGVPSGVSIALKNGWLPRTDGWAINSIGHIAGGGADYVIAVLTGGDPSMGYGISTVEGVSARVWAGLPTATDQTPSVVQATVGPFQGTDSAYLARGDGALYTTWQSQIRGPWQPFQRIGGGAPGGGIAGSPVAKMETIGSAPGAISAYAAARDGGLYTTWQTQAGGLWSSWQRIGGTPPAGGLQGSPAVVGAVAAPFTGALSAYARGGDGGLYTTWQTRAGGLWSSWQRIGGTPPGGGLQGSPAVVAATAGPFAGSFSGYSLGGDGALYTTWQDHPGGTWFQWVPIGGTPPNRLAGSPAVSQLSVTANAGALSVFSIGADSRLYATAQASPGGSWTQLVSIGS